MKLILSLIFLLSLNVYAYEEAFDGTKSLTPEQEAAAKTYVHQGLNQKVADEKCAEKRGGFSDLCTNDSKAFDGGIQQKLETMMPAVTKMYALITAAGGSGKLKALSKDSAGNQIYKNKDGHKVVANKEGTSFTSQKPGNSTPLDREGLKKEGYKKETEQKTDYCGYIASAGDIATSAFMGMSNKKTQDNFDKAPGSNKQAASFYAMADSHKSLAKTSNIQAGIWGGTAACYAALIATSTVQADLKTSAKLGGSTLIATFFFLKAKAHKQRAAELKRLASELPGAGNCNPFTETSCFCSEPTSFGFDPENFQAQCVPKDLVSRNKQNDGYVCVDKKRNADPQCNCKKDDSCIDNALKLAALDLGLNSSLLQDPLASLKPIADGYGSAKLGSTNGRNLAFANKVLKKVKPIDSPDLSLTNKEKGLARLFNTQGMPKAVSAYMAKVKTAPFKSASLSSNVNGNSFKRAYDSDSSNSKPRFVKGKTARRSSKRRRTTSKRKKRSKGNSIMLDEFTKKAQREAEIVKDEGRNIFDILSYRYKASAWSEFDEEIQKSMATKSSQ